MTLQVLPDADALAQAIAQRLTELVAGLQAQGRTPRLVLTGGSIAAAAYERIDADAADWSDVEFWFGDERFVPEGHADRNDQQARDAFLDRVGAVQIHSVAGNDCSLSAAEAADRYAATLPEDPFDVVLLGMGPDAHVASLFPGFAQLREVDRDCVEVFDSPKPPPVRVSMTYPAINHSQAVWFLVSGEDKADAVARALSADGSVDETPARGARGRQETRWLLDDAAASSRPDELRR
ncbi:MAG: 6-phosphogluconolactonase [Aeromicrobium sp.]